jgi:hypothetical protein
MPIIIGERMEDIFESADKITDVLKNSAAMKITAADAKIIRNMFLLLMRLTLLSWYSIHQNKAINTDPDDRSERTETRLWASWFFCSVVRCSVLCSGFCPLASGF